MKNFTTPKATLRVGQLHTLNYGTEREYELIHEPTRYALGTSRVIHEGTVILQAENLIGRFNLETGVGVISALLFEIKYHHLLPMYGARQHTLPTETLEIIRNKLKLK